LLPPFQKEAPSNFIGGLNEPFGNAKSNEQIYRNGVGKNSLIMNNPDLILRKSILTKNDAITQHK
jgi:hypothetical protein